MPRPLALLLVLVAFVGVTAKAAPPLSEQQVQAFIASVPHIDVLAREYEHPFDLPRAYAELKQRPRPMAAVVDGMRGRPVHGELRDVVRYHGFGGPAGWAQVGDRVLHAYAALQLEPTQARVAAEMQQRLREIDADRSLSPAQREQLKDLLRTMQADMRIVMPAPAADLEPVRPHLEALRPLLTRQPRSRS